MSQNNSGSWRARNKPYIYAVVFAILLTFFIAPEVIDDKSMSPEIDKGSVIIMTKQSYSAKRGAPDLGTVVVMEKNYAPKVSDDNIVARVVGKPKDTVEIKGGKLYRNGKEYKVKGANGDLGKSMKVKVDEDSVFLLCDNRDCKTDSRNSKLGTVSMKEIKGDAKMIIWPFSDFGKVGKNE